MGTDGMSYKLKPIGRIVGSPTIKIPRSEYPEVKRLDADGWTHYDIGARYGARPATVANVLRKIRRMEE
jgi:phage pi2 protein 07